MKVIGLWNSGSPAARAEIQKGLDRLDALGIAAVYPKASARHATRPESKARSFLAGPDRAKVEAFEELAGSRELSDILALRGGYGGIRLLPALDASSFVKRYDKRLWGYSDLTVVQHYLFNKCGAPWVHSPMLSSASFHSPDATEARWWKKSLSDATEGAQRHVARPLHDSVVLKRDAVHGTLLGGNLACLVSMMGTPWEPRFPASTLLFLEDVKEPAYKIDRMLHQLGAHRDIKNVRAVLLGHLTDCPHGHAIFRHWSESTGLPVYGGIKAGHEAPHLPLAMGERVSLERTNAKRAELVLPSVSLA